MFDNVANNLVNGLVVVYVLYSLFADVLSEISTTKMELPKSNPKEAEGKILNDKMKNT